MPNYEATYQDASFSQYLVLVRNASNQPVTTVDCQYVRDVKFGFTLPFPVLMDPGNQLSTHVGLGSSPADNRILIGQGGVLLYKSHYGNLTTLKNQINGALGL
ncbi:MAG: hypothetical protein VX223_18735 [Myxococcota bacterium]|nr:hypothetical protein [Myxococcota bacterium]